MASGSANIDLIFNLEMLKVQKQSTRNAHQYKIKVPTVDFYLFFFSPSPIIVFQDQ